MSFRYTPTYSNAMPQHILNVFRFVHRDPKRFLIDDLSHIRIGDREHGRVIGYIGSEALYLVDVEDRNLRTSHRHLKKIFRAAKRRYKAWNDMDDTA